MIAEKIKILLAERRITKTALAESLDIRRGTLNDYLDEKTFMTEDKIIKTAEFFKISIGELFGEEITNNDTSVIKLIEEQQKQIDQIILKLNNFGQ